MILDRDDSMISGFYDAINPAVAQLVACLPEEKQFQAQLAARPFFEYLFRLEHRLAELLAVEREFTEELTRGKGLAIGPNDDGAAGQVLAAHEDHTDADPQGYGLVHRLQYLLVDKTEAIHQQVYATLSALALLVQRVGPPAIVSRIPTKSMKKFLEFLPHITGLGDDWSPPEGVPVASFTDLLDILECSRDFRAKFISHPQGHAAQHWITYRSTTGRVVIVYCTLRSWKVFYRHPPRDPYDPEFEPHLDYKSFYVAPAPEYALNALLLLANELLTHMVGYYSGQSNSTSKA